MQRRWRSHLADDGVVVLGEEGPVEEGEADFLQATSRRVAHGEGLGRDRDARSGRMQARTWEARRAATLALALVVLSSWSVVACSDGGMIVTLVATYNDCGM